MSKMQTKLDYADAIADWFLDICDRHIGKGDFENALKSAHVAATILCRQNRTLASPRIEAALHVVAEHLSHDISLPKVPAEKGDKSVCLHVMDEALRAGGLTAMAIRWMRNDQSGRIHSVALLSQDVPIPDDLRDAVRTRRGNIYTADPAASFLQRARWLKKLAHETADYVILHIGVADVIAGVAFGADGGPPVMLVNHAAHIFWTGVSIADLVVNCRGSALETFWTSIYRDARCATVPIPLVDPNPFGDQSQRCRADKREAKEAIGVPSDATVILTVGAWYKYLPVDGLDFVETMQGVVQEVPEAFLLVVGFHADSRWNQASARAGDRIRALGIVSQDQLAAIHQAADVYVEGFPVGSTSALLEAGLQGIPVVLGPSPSPPPYTTDGVALDNTLDRATSISDYKHKIVQLSRNHLERHSCGSGIRAAIGCHHTGDGWRQYLETALKMLPPRHSVRAAVTPVPTPVTVHEYWSAFVAQNNSKYEETLEHAVIRALQIGLRPRLTKTVMQACRDYSAVRRRLSMPLPLLFLLCNCLLPLLPLKLAQAAFRLSAFLCRPSALQRLRAHFHAILRGRAASRSWYEEYRNARAKTDDS